MIKLFVFLNCPLIQVHLLPSHRDWEVGVQFFLDDQISKGWVPGLRERHFWIIEDFYLKGVDKEFIITSFLEQML